MHELSITESILDIVLKHGAANKANKVIFVHLQIGGLSDLEDEWLQRYFDYLSKDTIAEGAKLKIERTAVVIQCVICRVTYEAQPAQMGNLVCPACGSKSGTLVSGREYYVKTMEVQ
jgi:hydrogenase nickel incorporation protein HypA/HybF